ncbi:MAG: BON domain-containing protein [Blastocatellia bacterium]|nr:BON domain-containing protein [Blastocatellia bacterium]
MRKPIVILLLLALLGGGGYYVYTRGFSLPGWLGGSSSADDTTARNVKSALGLSKTVSAYNIEVASKDGVVTLTGQAASENVKSLAGEIARDTEGVKEVNNQITVDPGAQPSGESVRVEDLEIRAAILEALARSQELGGKNIEVKVENRMVTLSGSVANPAQRNGAEQIARAAGNVAGVTNNLGVANPQAATEPPAAPAVPADPNADLAKQVEFELFRTGAFDISTMKINAKDGTVTLSGAVRSLAERLLAERLAQGTPGVKKVENQLKVGATAAGK